VIKKSGKEYKVKVGEEYKDEIKTKYKPFLESNKKKNLSKIIVKNSDSLMSCESFEYRFSRSRSLSLSFSVEIKCLLRRNITFINCVVFVVWCVLLFLHVCSEAILNNQILRRTLHEFTVEFLRPIEEYFTTLLPNLKYITNKQTNDNSFHFRDYKKELTDWKLTSNGLQEYLTPSKTSARVPIS
jgi:hypothetical protein